MALYWIEPVGPDRARELLGHNEQNRYLRPTVVAGFAEAMRRGEWRVQGEPVKLTGTREKPGRLLDGQHRLHALIAADVTVEMDFRGGLPADSFLTLDQGVVRNVADALRQLGYTQATTLGATARHLRTFRKIGRMGNSGRVVKATPTELVELVQSTPGLGESIRAGRAVRDGGVRIPQSLVAALHYLASEIAPDDARAFFHALATGEQLRAEDPVFALRRQLTARSTRRPSDEYLAAVTVKAFNYYREGRRVQALIWRPSEDFPEFMRLDGDPVSADMPDVVGASC